MVDPGVRRGWGCNAIWWKVGALEVRLHLLRCNNVDFDELPLIGEPHYAFNYPQE